MSKKAMGKNPLGFIRNTDINDDDLEIEASPFPDSKHDKQENIGNSRTLNTQTHIPENDQNIYPINNVPRNGLPENWVRATYILQTSIVEKIRAVAYWERKQVKEVAEEAFLRYLEGKRIDPIPKKHNHTIIS